MILGWAFFPWILDLWFPQWLLVIKQHHQKKTPMQQLQTWPHGSHFAHKLCKGHFVILCVDMGREENEVPFFIWINECCRLGWDWKAFSNGREEQLPNPLSKVGVPSEFLANYKWLSLDGSDSFVHTRVQSTFSSSFGATVWVSLLAWNANVKMNLLPTDRKQEKLF